MGFVTAAPDVLSLAAAEVADVGSALTAAHTAAVSSTTKLVAAAGDEVSAAIAELFGGYGQQFQSLSAQAATFHALFVRALNARGGCVFGRGGG